MKVNILNFTILAKCQVENYFTCQLTLKTHSSLMKNRNDHKIKCLLTE